MFISVQYLRALAALMVLFTHTSFKLKTHSVNILDWFNIGSYGVDLFFIISGFIMCLNVDRKKTDFYSFMKSRFVRILPLYWFLTTVALIIYILNPSMINSSGGETSILASYLLYPTEYKYLNNNGWTLSYEFYFYIIFSSLIFLGESQRLASSIILFSLVLLGIVIDTNNYVLMFLTSPLLLEFMMGILSYYIIINNMVNIKKAGFFILMSFVMLFLVNAYGPVESVLGRALNAGVPMMFLFIGFVSLESLMPKNKLFYELGMASYSLYLLHPFVLSAVTLFSRKIGLNDNPFIYMAAMFGFSCLSGWICYQVIELTLDKKIKKYYILR